MVHASAVLGSIVLLAFAAGCAASRPLSPPEARNAAVQMKLMALADLYRLRPDAREHIRRSPGYAVFSNARTRFLPTSECDGYGVATDNRTGRVTFMRMAEAMATEASDEEEAWRVVYVFDSPEAFDAFLAGHAAEAVEASVASGPGSDPPTVYQLTESGVTLAHLDADARYFRDPELN